MLFDAANVRSLKTGKLKLPTISTSFPLFHASSVYTGGGKLVYGNSDAGELTRPDLR